MPSAEAASTLAIRTLKGDDSSFEPRPHRPACRGIRRLHRSALACSQGSPIISACPGSGAPLPSTDMAREPRAIGDSEPLTKTSGLSGARDPSRPIQAEA